MVSFADVAVSLLATYVYHKLKNTAVDLQNIYQILPLKIMFVKRSVKLNVFKSAVIALLPIWETTKRVLFDLKVHIARSTNNAFLPLKLGKTSMAGHKFP